MADWRDSVVPASIGGVRFFASEVRTVVGRRTSVRELPLRDIPATEDIGRKGRRYSVTGGVIGDDYMAQRDAVLAVLETAGPHRFVHPWRGEFDVHLDGDAEIGESDAEGGWARFSFTLVEAGEETALRARVATDAALTKATAAAVTAGAAELEDALSLDDIAEAAAAAVEAVADKLEEVKRKLNGELGLGESPLTQAISDLKEDAVDLVQTPSELGAEINALVGSVFALISDQAAEDASPYPGGAKRVRADATLEAAQDLAEIETASEGPTDEEEQAAEAAIGKYLKVATLASAFEAFAELEVESTEAAQQVLAVLGDLAEQLLVDPTTTDDLFVSLTDMKAALDAHLSSLAAALPSVQEYTPPQSIPALLIAFELYGDPTRDLEIVGRNRLPDPNFVSGAVPLKVLIDG